MPTAPMMSCSSLGMAGPAPPRSAGRGGSSFRLSTTALSGAPIDRRGTSGDVHECGRSVHVSARTQRARAAKAKKERRISSFCKKSNFNLRLHLLR